MSRTVQAILAGGFVAGVLDILYAFVVYGFSYGMTPVAVLQSVAAGWIGREAAQARGWETAALGLGTHFMIALVMAAAFVFAATWVRGLTTHALAVGISYGLLLYVVMNYVVVPLSAAHPSHQFAASISEVAARLDVAFSAWRPTDPLQLLGTIFTHTAFVGVPIALITRRIVGG